MLTCFCPPWFAFVLVSLLRPFGRGVHVVSTTLPSMAPLHRCQSIRTLYVGWDANISCLCIAEERELRRRETNQNGVHQNTLQYTLKTCQNQDRLHCLCAACEARLRPLCIHGKQPLDVQRFSQTVTYAYKRTGWQVHWTQTVMDMYACRQLLTDNRCLNNPSRGGRSSHLGFPPEQSSGRAACALHASTDLQYIRSRCGSHSGSMWERG